MKRVEGWAVLYGNEFDSIHTTREAAHWRIDYNKGLEPSEAEKRLEHYRRETQTKSVGEISEYKPSIHPQARVVRMVERKRKR